MSEWIEFEGRIMPLEWGDNIYTILPLPDDITLALRAQNTKRVTLEINDHVLNLALTKAPPIDATFVYIGKSILKEVGIEPSDTLLLRIKKVDPDILDIPDDVIHHLMVHGALEIWNGLTTGKKRGLLHPIVSAKKPETRHARLLKLVEYLRSTS